MEETLRTIAIAASHEALGAKMVPFAGYIMPLQYSGLTEEHLAVRNNVGIFDVSHMGEFAVKGKGALDLIQWVTSNDASTLTDGKVQYSCLTNDQGGIVDDLLIYRWNETEFTLVVNASNIQKDWDWINSQNNFDAELTNMSDDISLFAVQGPNATKVLQKITKENLSEMDYYTFKGGEMGGCKDVIISATGYTGSGGFEIYVWNKDAKKMWDAIMDAGAELDIKPCGLAARDTLRLEKGFCLYGNDINDTISPIEAGLGWITKFTKDFVMSEHHKAIKENKPSKKLVGFKMVERGIPRQDYPIVDGNGRVIGVVTSGTQSPSLNEAIGMGYVKRDFIKSGTDIYIQIRNKNVKAVVTKLPFV